MKVAVVDYGSGNLRSAAKALQRAGDGLGAEVSVSALPEAVLEADRIVLPGVGAFADCMRGLQALPGMVEALEEAAIRRARPFLGICVGMQLMARVGREHGDTPGLGWIGGEVVPLRPKNTDLKVPHMGWNDVRVDAPDHPVLAGLPSGVHMYFVHGYAFRPDEPAHALAGADYGERLAAVVGRDNLVGTQFHPEKSQGAGLALLSNFLRWRP